MGDGSLSLVFGEEMEKQRADMSDSFCGISMASCGFPPPAVWEAELRAGRILSLLSCE